MATFQEQEAKRRNKAVGERQLRSGVKQPLTTPTNLSSPVTAFREAQRIQPSGPQMPAAEESSSEGQSLFSSLRSLGTPTPVQNANLSVGQGLNQRPLTMGSAMSVEPIQRDLTLRGGNTPRGISTDFGQAQLQAGDTPQGQQDIRSAYERTIQSVRDGQGGSFDSSNAPGFKGSVMDSGAFRKQAAQFYKDKADREHRGALSALRERVKRGGFGANKAAASLSQLLDAGAAQTAADAKGDTTGTTALELARFGLDKEKFENTKKQQGQNALGEYFDRVYADDPEAGAQKFKLASTMASILPNLQSAAEADRIGGLFGDFINDTGVSGAKALESWSQIGGLKLSPDGKSLLMTGVDGKQFTDEGFFKWTRDMTPAKRAELINLWEKNR